MENDSTKKVLIIAGAGAVENAWHPIIVAIKNLFGIETDADGANFILAREVYLNKFYSTIKHPQAPKLSEISKNNLSLLKKEITKQIINSQQKKEIRIRANFFNIIENYIRKKKLLVVTTNWDKVVDSSFEEFFKLNGFSNLPRVFHLHGSVDNPENLYLPSEITPELYRTKEQENLIGKDHSIFSNILKEANEIIFYGISLDPLDVELTMNLSRVIQFSNLEKVVVVNPEHEKICNRLKLILFNKKINIEFINPANFPN